MIGTIFGSTVAIPTTVRQRKRNDLTARDVHGGTPGTSLCSGCGDHRLLLWLGTRHWLVLKGPREYRRRLFHGRTRDDRMGRRSKFLVGKSRRARTNGLGGISLPRSEE